MTLSKIGYFLMRFGVIVILIWIGLFKFTPTEAAAIRPYMENSPFVSWMLTVFGERGASNLIGGIELVVRLTPPLPVD